MKTKLILTTLLSFIFYLLSSQVPHGFNYQAVARNGAGIPIHGEPLQVKIGILSDTIAPVIVWEELHSDVNTNYYGVFDLVIGSGVKQAGSASSFEEIDWSESPLYLKTEIYYQDDWKSMGSAKIWSVPYAMLANDLDGPVKKLAVTGETSVMDEALFEVKNKDGQTVFAVYNEGVRIFVDDGDAKGAKGGFSIGGFGTSKAASQEYFVVDNGSIKVYVDDDSTSKAVKGRKGGFSIGGYDATKGLTNDYLHITPDSVRIYIDEGSSKGKKGGFSIGGFGVEKGTPVNLMHLTKENYFIGHESGVNNTTGIYNSFLGYQAGKSNIDGYGNIFIGYQSGLNNVGLPDPAQVGGNYGSFNCYVGYEAGYSSLYGAHNAYIGYASGHNSTSDNNTFVGSLSGSQNTVGGDNTFIGAEAGERNLTGSANVLLGRWAGWNIIDGSGNTLIGSYAGSDLQSGQNNVIIGSGAMADIYYGADGTGSSNVIIGAGAGKKALYGSSNIFIGNMAGSEVTGSNLLYISNTSTETPLIYGNFSNNSFRVNGLIEATGSITTVSDIALKLNIVELDSVAGKLTRIRGVYYDWDQTKDPGLLLPEGRQIGVIAQEVEKVYPELVVVNDRGFKTVDYTKLTPVLLEAFKEQQDVIESQNNRIYKLEEMVEEMKVLLRKNGIE